MRTLYRNADGSGRLELLERFDFNLVLEMRAHREGKTAAFGHVWRRDNREDIQAAKDLSEAIAQWAAFHESRLT
ncbi:hypothetical protein [Thalassobaculum litoreum]|uniref:Uncharacterized protein n=1 Tax=Thalassobaculum litoreum DSM 18839 TaxID=1123362 RepID=A0A8G2EYI3_9PROT|nr:hypothetical protein [Thalassobaculum litoreum]SDF84110.1 hypothetical protein SAMN05660686_02496 [Thalassobaculum litoreum DSM 18839]